MLNTQFTCVEFSRSIIPPPPPRISTKRKRTHASPCSLCSVSSRLNLPCNEARRSSLKNSLTVVVPIDLEQLRIQKRSQEHSSLLDTLRIYIRFGGDPLSGIVETFTRSTSSQESNDSQSLRNSNFLSKKSPWQSDFPALFVDQIKGDQRWYIGARCGYCQERRRFPFSSMPLSLPSALPLFNYVMKKRSLTMFLLEGFAINQSPRERTGVQQQQKQRECPRCRAAVARIPMLHRCWMLSWNMQ